ncbi:MAG: polyphosphate--nucleotide phosphotransferase [Bacteroidetes bacterium HGW-Bacteroidetes-1]|jgi:PPK2 family polyphosphate:nucleotide phosphotransferase|nr:MAG: polyphosphate--nucleotide phosphotransferase [Bacteroidetes bacterium HGW-Bacteroidetes-1]
MTNLIDDPKILAKPGLIFKVGNFDTEYTAGVKTKKEAEKLLDENIEELIKIQNVLYADNRHSILIVFQAMDAAGKDGTIKNVMSGLNPQGTQVYSFKAPSEMELDHDYFWRTYRCMPQRGNIGIFNRSYYEEVLIVRVHPEYLFRQRLPSVKKIEDVNDSLWAQRYRQINDMEKHLSENGTIVLKFFLNISKEQQKRRFLRRIDDPSRNWKFSSADVKERQYWDLYMHAYGEMLTHTSTEIAPWYVIPADNKWFMRYAVSNIIVNRLSKLDISYPNLPQEELLRLSEAKKLLQDE